MDAHFGYMCIESGNDLAALAVMIRHEREVRDALQTAVRLDHDTWTRLLAALWYFAKLEDDRDVPPPA